LGDPAGSKATAGIALRVTGIHKPLHHDKVQIPSGVTGSRGRKHRKLLDDLKERKGYSHLKEEALDRTMWRA